MGGAGRGVGGRSAGLKWGLGREGAPLSARLTLGLFSSIPQSAIKSLRYLSRNEVNFLSRGCLVRAALIPEGIATLPLPEQKELMESVTVKRNVVFSNLSLVCGRWSHPREWIVCSASRNGEKCAALGVHFFHLYSFFF